MFLVSGIVGLALTFWARQMPGFWWSLISAVLAIGTGIILLLRPVQGTLTLTIVVGAYFVAEGVATIMYALEHRRELSGRWSRMLVAGRIGALGDRSDGRHQPVDWRYGADRYGARRAQRRGVTGPRRTFARRT